METELWKKQQITGCLNSFFGQFGTIDEYSRVVLEVIFEELYGKTKTVSLPSTPGHVRDEIVVCPSNKQ